MNRDREGDRDRSDSQVESLQVLVNDVSTVTALEKSVVAVSSRGPCVAGILIWRRNERKCRDACL